MERAGDYSLESGGLFERYHQEQEGRASPRDLAIIDVLEKALEERTHQEKSLAALARESDRGLRDLIRRWQALPPHRRTNFLRKRIGPRGSSL